MNRNTPSTTTLILLATLLVLLPLAYVVYSTGKQAGDLAALNARLDGILDISVRNSARIEQLGASGRALENTVAALQNSALARPQGDPAPAPAAGTAVPGQAAGESGAYPVASAAGLLDTPRSYEQILNHYREQITTGGVSESMPDFADRFATTETGQALAARGVAIESATCSDSACLIEGDLAGHPALNHDALARLDPEQQEDAYYGFVQDFYASIREMGLPPSGALQRNGDKFYFYGRLKPRPADRKLR